MSVEAGEELNPIAPPEQKYALSTEQTTLGSFIEQHGAFHSEVDHNIAFSYAARIEGLYASGTITQARYENAATALRRLIPLDAGNGRRMIAGKILAPGNERRIASRLTAEEVDIASPDGSWGRLPKPIKRELSLWDPDASIAIEPSSHCTVGCSFCSVATIGPLAKKASFDSILAVVDDFASRQKIRGNRVPDVLYWGSDPFDLKWAATETTPERGYIDLVHAYLELQSTRERELYTSTAVPLGEELKVLAFADMYTNDSLPPSINLRLSRTTANAERVDHIQQLIRLFNPGKELPLTNYVDPAARGKRLEKPQDSIRSWDILGPNCRDGVIIGISAVESTVMLGASPERPLADVREPIETHDRKRRIYRIPRYHFQPEVTDRKPYPDVKWSVIAVNEKGRVVHRGIEKAKRDPHRALARLALGVDRVEILKKNNQLTPKAIARSRRRYRADLRLLQEHTQKSDNWVMRHILNTYVEYGLLD